MDLVTLMGIRREYYRMIPAVVDAGSAVRAICTGVGILADCKRPWKESWSNGATADEGNRTANLGDGRVRSLRER